MISGDGGGCHEGFELIDDEFFADGAGNMNAVACLPLAEGYSATFRNFDVQKSKATLRQLKVVGSEAVTVPAGKFDTYKVEITSADGGNESMTVWMTKDSRTPVKLSAVLAAQGGAIMTSELAQ